MIAVAKEKDIPAIGGLLMQMHHTAPMKLPPVAPHKVEAALRDCLKDGRIFVAHRGDKLVGVLALQEVEHWYSHGKFVGDLVFYVDAGARTSRIASRLLRAASDYATIRGLPLLMAVVHGEDIVRKDHFYARHGFARVGGVYSRGF
jgi:L-amino acid N-acyltransferase YncA